MSPAERGRAKWAAAAAVLLAAAAVLVLRYASGPGSKTESAAQGQSERGMSAGGPVVPVQTVPLREATITETITAYGTVVSRSGDVDSVSLPFETRVSRMRVTPGQRVAAGDVLLDADPSPGTLLQLRQARNAVDAAKEQLRQVERRYSQRLATNQELFTAQADLRAAQAKLDSLEREGAAGRRVLTAGVSGIVSRVDVQVGQIVPGGTPMVEVAAKRHIEVVLGVEPEDLPLLREGEPVRLSLVHSGSSNGLEGRVRLLTHRINPSSRLVDVFVWIPQDAKLLLGAYVHGILTTASKRALVVPRGAALPGEGGKYVLFTVANGRAVKHMVALGLENGREVEVVGGGLAAGDPVVVSGNYELEDGMAVNVEKRPVGTPAPGAAP